jgi:hypothetical protein
MMVRSNSANTPSIWHIDCATLEADWISSGFQEP